MNASLIGFTGRIFEDEIIVLDGKSFENCVFRRCKIDYNGTAMIRFHHVHFEDSTFGLGGGASVTLNLLRMLWHNREHRAVVIGFLSQPCAYIVESTDSGIGKGTAQ